jgi:hypothetical protein
MGAARSGWLSRVLLAVTFIGMVAFGLASQTLSLPAMPGYRW